MDLVLWMFFGLLFSSILQGLFEITGSFNSDRELRSVTLVCFAMLGLGGGLLTGVVMVDRVLEPGPFPGVSLLIVPLLLGAVMQTWGALSSRRSRRASHLATWYGGATLGLGLAAGRFIVLALIRSARAV